MRQLRPPSSCLASTPSVHRRASHTAHAQPPPCAAPCSSGTAHAAPCLSSPFPSPRQVPPQHTGPRRGCLPPHAHDEDGWSAAVALQDGAQQRRRRRYASQASVLSPPSPDGRQTSRRRGALSQLGRLGRGGGARRVAEMGSRVARGCVSDMTGSEWLQARGCMRRETLPRENLSPCTPGTVTWGRSSKHINKNLCVPCMYHAHVARAHMVPRGAEGRSVRQLSLKL